ncbi:27-O-demethylrifamycin SV methyltransferase [Paraconexibacter sp. AEG42_29]|uniref:27-O-demethylrifamycin SV methyltransferase n=1 Tax=Paraconexibacter sp. AEG42_29 TaxID=2997339 RepID=A0AAU7AWT2_9ACTN
MSHAPADHYDRVTAAWGLLLGEELHYGVFSDGISGLADATGELTRRMIDGGQIAGAENVLDVGCGTGAPAVRLAQEFGVHVTGITTSSEGIAAATARAAAAGVSERTRFEQRDGMANGLPDAAFDRVWVLESSHLMRRRDRLIAENARVLKPGGRMVLCDLVLQRPLDLAEVRRLREPLTLLRAVYGDARMEQVSEYRRLAEASGLRVDEEHDLTELTRPTFDAWAANAVRHHDEVVALIGEQATRDFADSCDVLRGFWDDGTLGYALIAAVKP